MKKPYWLFMLTFALVFYVRGAAFLEGFVNYRTWHLIGLVVAVVLSRRVMPGVSRRICSMQTF